MKKVLKKIVSVMNAVVLTVSAHGSVPIFAEETGFDISLYDKTELAAYSFEKDMAAISQGNGSLYDPGPWGSDSSFDANWGFNIQKGAANLEVKSGTATITSLSDWRMFLNFGYYGANPEYDFSDKIMYYSFKYASDNEWSQIGFASGEDDRVYWMQANRMFDAVRTGYAEGAGVNASSGDDITVITDNVSKKYHFYVNDKLVKTTDITEGRTIKGIVFNPSGGAYISVSNFKFGELTEKDTGVEKASVTVADNIEYGTVTVLKSEYSIGSIVKVTATPMTGYILESLKANGIDIINNEFTVTEDTVITATFVRDPQIIVDESFHDDFDDKSGWKDIRGDWIIQNEADRRILSQASAANISDMGTVIQNRVWTDAIYEFDVRYDGSSYNNKMDNWFGISFRKDSQDTDWRDNSGYMLFWRINGEMAVGKGNAQDIETVSCDAHSVDATAKGEWHHLKVVNNGYGVKVFIDGSTEPIYDKTDSSGHSASGYFSINTCQSAWSVKDFYVRADGDITQTYGYYDKAADNNKISIPVVLFDKAVNGMNLTFNGELKKSFAESDYTAVADHDNITTYTFNNSNFSSFEDGTYTIELSFDDNTKKEYTLLVGSNLDIGDKTALCSALIQSEQYIEIDYTNESWERMKEAQSEAETVNDKLFASQTEINEVLEKLLHAMENLEERGECINKGALNAAIAKAEGFNEMDYTPLSCSRLLQALREAREVSKMEEITEQAVIDDALRNLEIAIRNLQANRDMSEASYTNIENLKTNDLIEPYGIQDETPSFSWKMNSNIIGQEQIAYEVRVARDESMTDVIWTSGKCKDSKSYGIEYKGKAFEDSTTYYWSIKVWDKFGNEIESGISCFTTALLSEDSWNKSSFITPADAAAEERTGSPIFRREFEIDKKIKNAVIYTTALGSYDAYINGERVGELLSNGTVRYDELKPCFTDMGQRLVYNSYDVTHMINSGNNTVSAIVTNGFWNNLVTETANGGDSNLAFRAQLHITYDDGSSEIIGTDENWQASYGGPVLYGEIFNGEIYDATADTSWMGNNFNGEWKNALTRIGGGRLTAQEGQRTVVRNDLELEAERVTVYEGAIGADEQRHGIINTINVYGTGEEFELKKGQTAVIDFGQNFAGWAKIQLSGSRGAQITMKHGEMLNDNNGLKSRGNDGPEGSVYFANLRGAEAADVYIMSGNGTETYRPTHTYHGFRYISMTATEDITVKNVVGQVLTSVEKETGYLYTSNASVNRLFSNGLWGQYSNYLGIPTDCPQRTERQGWMADTWVFSTTGAYNAETYGFMFKWMKDMQDAQVRNKAGGDYGVTAPLWFRAVYRSVGWADAGVIVPYNMYKMYGDSSIINDNYASMRQYVDTYLHGNYHPQGAGNERDYGDWLFDSLNTTELKEYLGSVFLAWDYQMMAEMAEVTGKTTDAQQYRTWYNEAKAYFNETYVNADGSLKLTQPTAYLYALRVGLLPNEASEQTVLNSLTDRISRNGDKLETGFLGTAILLQTLTDFGRGDVAYKLLLQREYPSWLFTLDQGATTFWERWNSYTEESGFGPVDMNSFNHYSFGVVCEWMYSYMAGIMYDTNNPGFKHIVLQPLPDSSNNITFTDGSYDSAYGKIESNWERNGDTLSYSAVVPANTAATLYLPVTNELSADNLTADKAAEEGIEYIGIQMHNGILTAKFEIKSGGYSFAVTDDSIKVELQDGYYTSTLTDVITYNSEDNTVTTTLSGTIIICNYDSDGRLIDIAAEEVEAGASITPKIEVTANTRIYLWDNLQNMKPLTKVWRKIN